MRAVLPGRQLPEQQRGLRGAECECPQLLDWAPAHGWQRSAWLSRHHSPAGPAQVHDTRARAPLVEQPSIASEPTPAAACAPLLNGRTCTVTVPAVAADPGEQAELPVSSLPGRRPSGAAPPPR